MATKPVGSGHCRAFIGSFFKINFPLTISLFHMIADECDEKNRIQSEYRAAAQLYSAAVAELTRRIGTSFRTRPDIANRQLRVP
jgi:hypothetical protein